MCKSWQQFQLPEPLHQSTESNLPLHHPTVHKMAPLASLISSLPQSTDSAWGPPSEAPSSAFKDVPYAPYSKGDKLGRMADWSQETGKDGQPSRNRQGYGRQYRGMLLEYPLKSIKVWMLM